MNKQPKILSQKEINAVLALIGAPGLKGNFTVNEINICIRSDGSVIYHPKLTTMNNPKPKEDQVSAVPIVDNPAAWPSKGRK